MNDRRGFTLIEVIMAVLIFTIMMGGMMSAGLVASNQLKMGRNDVRIWEIATYQMEKLISLGYDSLRLGIGRDTIKGHPVTWTVTNMNPKKILLVIDRKDIHGNPRTESFVTYLSDS